MKADRQGVRLSALPTQSRNSGQNIAEVLGLDIQISTFTSVYMEVTLALVRTQSVPRIHFYNLRKVFQSDWSEGVDSLYRTANPVFSEKNREIFL